MTRRQAYERVDRGDLTYGHLKHYVDQCFDQDMFAVSAVNPQLTRGQALDILRAGLASFEDNDLVVSPRYTKARNARGALLAVNVLRETDFPMRTSARSRA